MHKWNGLAGDEPDTFGLLQTGEKRGSLERLARTRLDLNY